MALFLSSLRVPRILSFVEIILAASPRSGQVLKSSIDIWTSNPCKALYTPPYSAIGALYNRVDFPSWSEEVQGQTWKWILREVVFSYIGQKSTWCRVGCSCTSFQLLPPWPSRGSWTCCIWNTSPASIFHFSHVRSQKATLLKYSLLKYYPVKVFRVKL